MISAIADWLTRIPFRKPTRCLKIAMADMGHLADRMVQLQDETLLETLDVHFHIGA